MISWLRSLFTNNVKSTKKYLPKGTSKKMKELKDAGASIEDIMEEFKVSKSTVYRQLKKEKSNT